MTLSHDLQALEQFVVNNDELLALESRIGRFNIFDALGIARVEIRHSNFLAFLLDPAESHGQGDLFLKAILMDLLRIAPQRPFSPIYLDGADMRGVEVKREREGIDLLIRCREPKLLVVIENKVDSQEHSDQLGRYEAAINKRYPDSEPLFVFLTKGGDESSRPNTWVPYSYQRIFQVLKRVRDANKRSIGEDVLAFLDHYLNLIGTRFMDDEEIDKLCRQIYQKHRQALRLIYDRAGNPAAGAIGAVEEVLEQAGRWHYYAKGYYIDFLPSSWLEWLPPHGIDEPDHRKAWIVFRFQSQGGRLDFYAEVRRVLDPYQTLRKTVVDCLITEAPKCGFKKAQARSEVTNKYSRFCGRDIIDEWGEEDEPNLESISVKVRLKLDEISPGLDKLAIALKPLMK